jgi:MSHA biogenesis protein MshQ
VGDNVWHFVAVTFDGVTGAQRLYLDGNLDGSGNATGSLNGDQVAALTIGAWNGDGSGYSSSSIHDVRIFDTVLSQSDLQALQAQDAVPEPTTLALAGLSVLGLLGYGVTRLKSSKGL